MVRSAELDAISAVLADRFDLRYQGMPRWDALNSAGLATMASRHRVAGLVLATPGAELLPSDALVTLARIHRMATMNSMRQAVDLVRLLEAFSSAATPVLLIKGQAFSEVAYGDWTIRGVAADADLLIPPSAIPRAHAILTEMGYHCAHDEGQTAPLSGLHGRYSRWVHYERSYLADGLLNVDLHWRPVPGSEPWTDFDRLWAGRRKVVVHNRTVDVPEPAACLRISAAQGIVDGWPTLRSATDVVACAQLMAPQELVALAEGDSLVAHGLARAAATICRGNPAWDQAQPWPTLRHWRRSWRLRSRTDPLPRALMRSALGLAAPARRLGKLGLGSQA